VRVTVQLFARLREIAGRQQWLCELPPGASVADLWRELAVTYPAMAEFASAVSCAVNTDFAPMSTELHEGDDVAFLPPVSGGAARLR
jgi:molybdopterin converting factor subunit 1